MIRSSTPAKVEICWQGHFRDELPNIQRDVDDLVRATRPVYSHRLKGPWADSFFPQATRVVAPPPLCSSLIGQLSFFLQSGAQLWQQRSPTPMSAGIRTPLAYCSPALHVQVRVAIFIWNLIPNSAENRNFVVKSANSTAQQI